MSVRQAGAASSRSDDVITRGEVQALIAAAGGGGSTAAVTANRMPAPAPPVGSWIWPATVAVESQRPSNGDLRLSPVWLPPGTYDSLAWSVSNAGSAGATIKAVVYDDNAGALGSLLLDVAAVAADVNTGTYQVTGLSLTSPAAGRLVWAGLVNQGAPTTLPNLLAIGRVPGNIALPAAALSLQFTNTLAGVWQVNGVTGAAPATPTATFATASPARVLFRKSA